MKNSQNFLVSSKKAKFTLVFSVTEEYFLTLADKLRPHTEQAMKIEPAPWIRTYLVNMDDLYTELILEKLENKPYGLEHKKLENYKELFLLEEAADNPSPPKKRKVHSSKKILTKGDPGMGKTTLSKRIAWDWAKGNFAEISIVFFVLLKLVKPGDTIESVIIKQTPVLEGMQVTRERLSGIFEKFGDRCLLILDGLDEHALGQNEDVHKIIRGAKCLNCNVFLTSRPHSTGEIERYFETIIRIEGFTRDEARKFASRIVQDEEKVKAILDFKPIGVTNLKSLHSIPILLSILCLLVRENDIDLSSKALSLGELYVKMMRCLYKKYAIRKGKPFEIGSFCKVLKLVGKIAFETLLSQNPYFQRGVICRLVGDDAFDYGLLIGHEDFELIGDETADISVTFPHRSLQEFLGAFYFVLMLNEGVDLDTLLGKFWRKPIFMSNPLFLQFCIWIAGNLKTTFSVRGTVSVKEVLMAYAVKILDKSCFDIEKIKRKYPTISIKEKTAFSFHVLDILAKCRNVEHLAISDQIDRGLSALRPVFKHLKSIHIPHKRKGDNRIPEDDSFTGLFVYDKGDFNLFLHFREEKDIAVFNVVLEHCTHSTHYPCISCYFLGQQGTWTSLELATFFNEELKGLRLHGSYNKFCCSAKFPHNRLLDQLCLREISDEDIFVALSTAIQEKRFPHLRHLTFVECFFNMEGKLSLFFQCCCPTLKHLGLYDFKLDHSDLQFLASVNTESEKSVLPNLSSLGLSSVTLQYSPPSISKLFSQPWSNLSSITFADATMKTSRAFLNAVNKGKLPNVVELRMSARVGEDVNVNFLQPEQVPRLESLTLARIVTSGPKLGQLVQKIGKWKLQHLNLSYSPGIYGRLSFLLSDKLPSLKSLVLRHCHLQSHDMGTLAQANAEGKLPKLEYLDVTDNLCKQALENLTHDPSSGQDVTWKTVKYDESDD